MVRTIHVHSKKNYFLSMDYFFTVDNTKIFITTDTQFLLDRYRTYYQSADLIFTIIERMNNRIWCAQ